MKTITQAELDLYAAEQRSRSVPVPRIAAELNVSISTVYRMIERAFAALPMEGAIEARKMELAKLDRVEAHLLSVMERAHVRIDHGRVCQPIRLK